MDAAPYSASMMSGATAPMAPVDTLASLAQADTPYLPTASQLSLGGGGAAGDSSYAARLAKKVQSQAQELIRASCLSVGVAAVPLLLHSAHAACALMQRCGASLRSSASTARCARHGSCNLPLGM